MRESDKIGAALMRWYDVQARILPWRVPPEQSRMGVRADPYHVWLSEVMLQQTTVAAVREPFARFLSHWPRLADLAAADDATVMGEWAGLGYYARARNLIACARAVMRDHDGMFPDNRDALLGLPGIGPYTAAAIASIAFDRPETVVDGNIERVMARLYDIHTPLPDAKRELTALAAMLTPQTRPGDHAQALMDLGATICTPRAPNCGLCPLARYCHAHAQGTAAILPKRRPRAERPLRRGHIYVGQRVDGALLLETREASGLLGGMLGWPGSEWGDDPAAHPPVAADWQPVAGEVRHIFTHFNLRLAVYTARLPQNAQPAQGAFVPADQFRPRTLPGVMRKVWTLARDLL